MIKTAGLYIFATLFMLAGIGHFVLDDFFIAAMPQWVPFRETIVYLSGVVEILLAGLLIYPRTRQKAGVWTAVFLVLVFPVNIYMALNPEAYHIPPVALWLRLPLQIVLIWWILAVTGNNWAFSRK